MYTQSHNEIINLQVWREQTLKLIYVCLTMQMFIWHKKNSKVENIKWQTYVEDEPHYKGKLCSIS